MVDVLILITLGLFGLVLGSFAGATVWRLRARQLLIDKQEGESVDKKEYARLKPLMKRKTATDRSCCLECGYTLRWYDLIPLVSWVALRGRCRSCRKKIGWFEPLMELGMAAFFIASYLFWPVGLADPLATAQFVVWLAAGVGLVILFAYDAKWFLLPDKVTWTVVALGVVNLVLVALLREDVGGTLLNAAGAIGALGGLYLLLYLVSRGRWIGFGDVKLGLALGLLLVDWPLGLLALFLANLIGCLIVIPLMIKGTLTRSSHVPFGPLLIVGAVIAQLFGAGLVEWYTVGLF